MTDQQLYEALSMVERTLNHFARNRIAKYGKRYSAAIIDDLICNPFDGSSSYCVKTFPQYVVKNGYSKNVIIPKNGQEVVKFIFRRLYTNELYEPTIYASAKECGLENFFCAAQPMHSFDFKICGEAVSLQYYVADQIHVLHASQVPVSVMEKLFPNYNRMDADTRRKFGHIQNMLMGNTTRRVSSEFLKVLLSLDDDTRRALINFIIDNAIDDLHNGNWGLTPDTYAPLIFDYSGNPDGHYFDFSDYSCVSSSTPYMFCTQSTSF